MTNTPTTMKRAGQRHFKGVVTAAAQQKTIVVRVDHLRFHTMYQKRYTISKKYQVHDEAGQYQVGDVVEFIECRPLSKHKKWRAVAKAVAQSASV